MDELKKKIRSIRLDERVGLIPHGVATTLKVDALMDHTMRVPKLSERHIRDMHAVYVAHAA